MPRRKRWEDLSPAYRRRLERAGITKRHHQSGKPVQRARGHTREDEGLRHLFEKIQRNSPWLGIDSSDFREARREHGDRLVYQMLRYQERMSDAYASGDYLKAAALYNAMPSDFDALPDWMKKYHGVYGF